MGRLPIEVENEILADNLQDTERALAQALNALGITLSGYIGEEPNRYYVYATNDDNTEFTAIHVDINGLRIYKEATK